MNKYSKIAIVLGLALMCIGFLASAFNFKALFKPFFNEEAYEKIEYYANADVKKLVIETDNEAVKIIPADITNIKVTYFKNGREDYKLKELNGVLSLEKNDEICIFCFNFNFKATDVVIEVPRHLALEYNIETDNAKIEIKEITILNAELDTSNGSIRLDNINANNLKLKTSNGRITLNTVEAQTIYAKSSNAKIIANNVRAERLELKTSNGRIECSQLESPYIDLKTSNGKIIGSIVGFGGDYQREITTSNGHIEIDGIKQGSRIKDGAGNPNKLIVKTSNGGIELDFE